MHDFFKQKEFLGFHLFRTLPISQILAHQRRQQVQRSVRGLGFHLRAAQGGPPTIVINGVMGRFITGWGPPCTSLGFVDLFV